MRAVIAYIIALPGGVIIALAVYRAGFFLHGTAIGRLIARLFAAWAGSLAFVLTFYAFGATSVLNKAGGSIPLNECIRMGLAMGTLYALLWPIAPYFRR